MMSMSLKALRDCLWAGESSVERVVEDVLADIAERNQQYGAFLEVFSDRARQRARELDAYSLEERAGLPLFGIPVAIKDNMLYAGELATAGSRMLATYRAPYSATVLERIEQAGGVIIGRVNMDEFAMGSSTETSAWGVTRNPNDVTKIPGGSSGGSAVAVAAGFVPLALGSDTGGSIRQPAALCGIVGVKPTYGAVSRYGIIALASSLDQVGSFTTNVEDAEIALRVMSAKDPHDATTREISFEAKKSDVRIAVPKEFLIDGLAPEIRTAFMKALDIFKNNGAHITSVELPLARYALPMYYILQPAEASSNLARYDGMRYGSRGEGDLAQAYLSARSSGFGIEVKRRLLVGAFVLSSGHVDAYYHKARAAKQALIAQYHDTLRGYDVFASPTTPTTAWNLGDNAQDPLAMYLADILTVTANIVGSPALSLPLPVPQGSLPCGLQLMGASGDDGNLLRVAAWCEAQLVS